MTIFYDLRISRRIRFGERINLGMIADMFNLANRFDVAGVNVLWTNADEPTSAYDPPQFQFVRLVSDKFVWGDGACPHQPSTSRFCLPPAPA